MKGAACTNSHASMRSRSRLALARVDRARGAGRAVWLRVDARIGGLLKRCLVIAALMSNSLVGCAPLAPAAPVTPEPKGFASKHPRIVSVDPARDNQLRDGVRIIVTPTPFYFDRLTTTEFRLQSALVMVNGGPADRRDRSEPGYGPEELRFKIRVSNRLPRVVRLAGTAVAFQLAGRTINVPHERYANFLNGIILPQQEITLDLIGPSVREIVGADLNKLPGDSATLALLLYDVVTATDAAGTPTRRSNFEYYYRFSLQPARDSIVSKNCRLKLALPAYNRLRIAAQGDVNRWVKMPELESAYRCPTP